MGDLQRLLIVPAHSKARSLRTVCCGEKRAIYISRTALARRMALARLSLAFSLYFAVFIVGKPDRLSAFLSIASANTFLSHLSSSNGSSLFPLPLISQLALKVCVCVCEKCMCAVGPSSCCSEYCLTPE